MPGGIPCREGYHVVRVAVSHGFIFIFYILSHGMLTAHLFSRVLGEELFPCAVRRK